MPAAAIVVTAAGTALSAYSQIKAGHAQRDAANASADAALLEGQAIAASREDEARMHEFNAAVAALQAKDALARGEYEANRMRGEVKREIGTARTDYAAGNIDVGFGTAVDAQSDIDYLGQVDALMLRVNAAREAWGYHVEEAGSRYAADVARRSEAWALRAAAVNAEAARAGGAAANTLGWLGAATTIATNAGQILMAKYGGSIGKKKPGNPYTVSLEAPGLS